MVLNVILSPLRIVLADLLTGKLVSTLCFSIATREQCARAKKRP